MTIEMTLLAVFIAVVLLLFLFSFMRGLARVVTLGLITLFSVSFIYAAWAY